MTCLCENPKPMLLQDKYRFWYVCCNTCYRLGLKSKRKVEARQLWDDAVEGTGRFLYSTYTKEGK